MIVPRPKAATDVSDRERLYEACDQARAGSGRVTLPPGERYACHASVDVAGVHLVAPERDVVISVDATQEWVGGTHLLSAGAHPARATMLDSVVVDTQGTQVGGVKLTRANITLRTTTLRGWCPLLLIESSLPQMEGGQLLADADSPYAAHLDDAGLRMRDVVVRGGTIGILLEGRLGGGSAGLRMSGGVIEDHTEAAVHVSSPDAAGAVAWMQGTQIEGAGVRLGSRGSLIATSLRVVGSVPLRLDADAGLTIVGQSLAAAPAKVLTSGDPSRVLLTDCYTEGSLRGAITPWTIEQLETA